jgi:predicted RNA-binding protein with PUA-like domain
MANYWLFKTEPETFSFETLMDAKKTPGRKTAWNGVRNYQARNFLRECKKGDLAVIYHSGKERSAVGLVKILKEGFPELDPKKKGDWVQLEVGFAMKLNQPVTLTEMKANPKLKSMMLIKQSRLSCMPVTTSEFKTILEEAGSWDDFQKLK